MKELYIKRCRKEGIMDAIKELQDNFESGAEDIKGLNAEKFKKILITEHLLELLKDMDTDVNETDKTKTFQGKITKKRNKILKDDTNINCHLSNTEI